MFLTGCLVGGAPAAALPAVDPLGDAVAEVLAVAVEPHPARPLQRLQSRDCRRHLHAVVGRIGRKAAQFLLRPAIAQDGGPPAGPGLPRQAPSVNTSTSDSSGIDDHSRAGRQSRGETAACGDTRAGPSGGPAPRRLVRANRTAGSTESAMRHRAPAAAAPRIPPRRAAAPRR